MHMQEHRERIATGIRGRGGGGVRKERTQNLKSVVVSSNFRHLVFCAVFIVSSDCKHLAPSVLSL